MTNTSRLRELLAWLKLSLNDSSLESVHGALEAGIRRMTKALPATAREEEDERHIDDACDYIEALLGPAFVAVQVYIAGFRRDVEHLAKLAKRERHTLASVPNGTAAEVLGMGPRTLSECYSDAEVLNAIANFWKHHEEWPVRFESHDDSVMGKVQRPVWDTDKMKQPNHKTTAMIAIALGIRTYSTGQLRTACEACGVTSTYSDFGPIRLKAKDWAQAVYDALSKEINSIPGLAMLPDVLDHNLRVVFCGTAVGAKSAEVSAYYAGPGNKFWRTLHAISLTPKVLAPHEYASLLKFGVGLTDLVKSKAGADAILASDDFGKSEFEAKIRSFAPHFIGFNGKRAAQEYLGRKRVSFGLLDERIGRTHLFVLPSTSGAASGYWDEGPWYQLGEACMQPRPVESRGRDDERHQV